MSAQDICWHQRFSNYLKAYAKLEEAVHKIKEQYPIGEEGTIDNDSFLDDIIKEGRIQRFEYTHELAWNVMKYFLENAGNNNIFASRDATREAFSAGLINDGDVWMDMIRSRNKTIHTYNEETADDIFLKIVTQYQELFLQFKHRMEALRNEEQGRLL